MKKVLAIVLALVMALSCTAIAFADDTYECPGCHKTFSESTYTDHLKVCADYQKYARDLTKADVEESSSKAAEASSRAAEASRIASSVAAEATSGWANTCPYCGNIFNSESAYDAHIEICYSQNGGVTNGSKNFFNLTASQVLDKIKTFFEDTTNFYSVVQVIIIRLMDLIENMGTAAVAEADVAGAVDDLESEISSLPLVGDALEYVTNLLNTLKQKIKDFYAHDVETVADTDAEAPVDTGSSSAGVIAFAVVSVAAAAAFVCTKKKEN